MRPFTLQMVATIEAIKACDLCATMGYPDSGINGYGTGHTIKLEGRRVDDKPARVESCKAQLIYQKAGIARYAS